MLRWRLIAAFCIIGPLLLLVWLDDQANWGRPGIWLGPLTVVISILAAAELNAFLRAARLQVSPANLFAVGAVTISSLTPLIWHEYPTDCLLGKPGWTLVGAALGLALLFLFELWNFEGASGSIQRLAGGMMGVVYLGIMLGFLIQLRLIDSPPLGTGRIGLLAVFATLWIVKLSDAGAFFVGKAVGRTKLTKVSPGKTVEGLIGGILAAILGAWLFRDFVLVRLTTDIETGTLVAYIGYACSLALAGLIGDLGESLLKRDVGEKDSSHWLPGLGGTLDVIDSLLSTAPVSFLWWSTDLLYQAT